MPKVSVIVPIYNVEKYLCRCIDSILSQSFKDFELWLVDDGSPDRCGEICEEYAKSDSRIRVIHKENGGLSDARNAALDKAKGEYISFIDSDDYVSPNFLAHMLDAIERNNAELAICNINTFYDNGTTTQFYMPAIKEEVLFGDDIFKEILQPSAWNKVYRSKIFSSLRYPKGRLYEDAFIYPEILAKVKTLVLTGYTDYYYYMRADSIMRRSYDLHNSDIIDATYTSSEKLDMLNQPKAAEKIRSFIYSQCAVAFAKLSKKNPAHKKRLSEIKDIYKKSYKKLCKDTSSSKQKLRYAILRFSPVLHTLIWGRKMNQLT